MQLTIKNIPTTFHVIAEELPLAVNGILGIGFLQQEAAELSFHHGTMVLSSDPIRPIPFQDVCEGNHFLKPTLGLIEKQSEFTTHMLPARRKTLITLKVDNTNLTEGYLPRIKAIEGIFIGEAVVEINANHCKIFAINTLDQDAEIDVPTQVIHSFESFDESDDCFEDGESQGVILDETSRSQRILDLLRLEHLNQEEQSHVLSLVKEYPDLLHLPGDLLPAPMFFNT